MINKGVITSFKELAVRDSMKVLWSAFKLSFIFGICSLRSAMTFSATEFMEAITNAQKA